MNDEVNLIFDIRETSVSFRAFINGRDFEHLRGTAHGSKHALDIEKTASKAGFRFINSRAVFQNTTPIAGDEVRRVADTFQKMGFRQVCIRGGNVAAEKPAAEYGENRPKFAA